MSKDLERLWAPWRHTYIESTIESSPDSANKCFLCEASAQNDDSRRFIIHRSSFSIALLNLYPYNNGHLLIAPNRHIATLADLDPDESADLFNLVRKTTIWLNKVYTPDGFNIGMNLGRSAGAGLPSHIHFHVVPRWNGDTNFMPVLGSVKVLSESLEDTWKKLREVLD